MVVVEDHPQWQKTLYSALLRLGTRLTIEIAGDLDQATQLLAHGGPALVFVDLGLPLRAGDAPEPDAGLRLIRKFTGTERGMHHQHRFVVLTAATNYSEAVYRAVELGVAPESYLHKNPVRYEADIAAQVSIALQPSKKPLPRIQLDVASECIARLDGYEIRLDRPIWYLLAAFAGGYWTDSSKSSLPRWRSRITLAATLAQSSLDPAQTHAPDVPEQSEEADEDDPAGEDDHNPVPQSLSSKLDETIEETEARLRRRLPDYVSTLRQELDRAYRLAHHEAPPRELIQGEEGRYMLNAELYLVRDRQSTLYRHDPPLVLVVEDDEHWRHSIAQGLHQRGFQVITAPTIADAKQAVENNEVDLISLDLELPADRDELSHHKTSPANALQFLRFMHDAAPHIAVAVLTGIAFRDSVMPQIIKEGVRIEDYIHKGEPEPVMHLSISMSRLWLESTRKIRILDWEKDTPVHPIHFDPRTGVVIAIGPKGQSKPLKISGAGQKILATLSRRPNAPIAREHLLDAVYPDTESWGKDPDNALDLQISRLRKAIFEQTGVSGAEVICGGPGGVYWLSGIPQ
jgi:two-component system torCAD operon response regulator TorR